MKVADAITAIDSTLRPGRYEALRSPSRATGRHPWPSTKARGGLRYAYANRQRQAPRSAVPAPKNAPVRSTMPVIEATMSVAPSRARTTDAAR